MKVVGLIPARGGSQRIPRKNVKSFAGRPAISRVAEAMEESGVFSEIAVSTDVEEIAQIAGARADVHWVPRPADLSDSLTGVRPVIQHAVTVLGLADEDVLGVFYATAVLLTKEDVRESYEMFVEVESDFLLSAATYPGPIERALELTPEGFLQAKFPESQGARSQDLPDSYRDLGQFYWGTVAAWKTTTPVAMARSAPFIIDSTRAIDIDTPADWDQAEVVYRGLGRIDAQ